MRCPSDTGLNFNTGGPKGNQVQLKVVDLLVVVATGLQAMLDDMWAKANYCRFRIMGLEEGVARWLLLPRTAQKSLSRMKLELNYTRKTIGQPLHTGTQLKLRKKGVIIYTRKLQFSASPLLSLHPHGGPCESSKCPCEYSKILKKMHFHKTIVPIPQIFSNSITPS